MDRVPVLYDTDIGSDIDDAVALAYLLAEPRCELLGITTVTGQPRKRAMLADALCRAAGRTDMPIHVGLAQPFLGPQRQAEAPQASILSLWPHRKGFPPNTAVPFMRQVIRARPGEVTLVAVGPFTNVALLFALDPEIPSLLRELVLMGGVYTTGVAGCSRTEWNASGDPHSTARMFQTRLPRLRAFGLDVTLRCRLSVEECRRRFRSRGGPLNVVADMAEVWFKRVPHVTFHDPLAAVAVFQPEVCEYQRGLVEVELTSPRLAGMTHWTEDDNGPHHVALGVDTERFFDHYFSVFT